MRLSALRSTALPLAALFSGPPAFAAFRWPDKDARWESPFTRGAGDVGGITENWMDKQFRDPAALADVKGPVAFEWLALGADYSKDLKDTAGEFSTLAKTMQGGSSGTSAIVGIMDGLRTVFGRELSGQATVGLLGVRIKSVGIVPHALFRFHSRIDVPSYPRVEALADGYLGIGTAASFALGGKGGWKIAMGLRPGVRFQAEADASLNSVGQASGLPGTTPAAASSSTSSLARYGAAFYLPVDLGASYEISPQLRTYGLMRDTFGSRPLTLLVGERKPDMYPMHLNLGLTGVAWTRGTHKLTLGGEIQDMFGLFGSGGPLYRTQLGAQYTYRLAFRSQTSFGLSAGLHQGYPSVAVFADFFLAKLEFAAYAREGGYYIGQNPERRYSLRAVSSLSF